MNVWNVRNAIEMYNGEFFDPRQLIGEINVNSTLRQRRLRYATSAHYDTMGIRITGSPAFGDFGFIAELVTLPQSPSGRPDFGNIFTSIILCCTTKLARISHSCDISFASVELHQACGHIRMTA